MKNIRKLAAAVAGICAAQSVYAAASMEFGGWQYDNNGQIIGILSNHGISTPFSKQKYDPTNVNITGGSITGVTNLENTQHVFCTGSKDDLAINAAIAMQNSLGGGVVDAHGFCDITSSVVMMSSIRLIGDGIGLTVLKLHAGVPYGNLSNVVFAQAPTNANLTNFEVSNMTIDGNNVNEPAMIYARSVASISPTLPYTVSGSNNTITFSIDGAATSTATIASATYSTLYTLSDAVNTAVHAANTHAYALQFNGNLAILSDNGVATGSVTNVAGNGAAGLFGTPVSIAGTTDNAYNGIVVRGNPNELTTADHFVISNIEIKNAGYHGIAVYDGASQFRLSDIDSHNNNFRCIHVHSYATGIFQPTNKYQVSRNRCHDDGQGTMLPITEGSGMFVAFDGVSDVSITDNIIWNEPSDSFDIAAASDGAVNPTRSIIAANNQVFDSGGGISVVSTNLAPISNVTITGSSARNIAYPFILGSAAAGLTITAGSNDTLTVNLAGTVNSVVIPPATYGSAALLATAIQTAVNTAYASTGSQLAVSAPAAPAGYIYALPQFTNGFVNNAFSISAPGSQSAFATVFGSTPVQYGNRRQINGGGAFPGKCFTLQSNGSQIFSDIVVSGNRFSQCASWGMLINGFSVSFPGTRTTITGNTVDDAGQDNSVNTGGLDLVNVNGMAVTGNTIVNSNTKAAAGRQLYLNSNATNISVVGNYLDTVASSGAFSPLDIASSACNNTITGNVLNRNNGTSNQFNNACTTPTSNIIDRSNILGLAGAGTGVNLTQNVGTITVLATAPTLASGGCTTPSAITSNTWESFSVNVGTSCSGSQPLVFTLPAAPHSWSCNARDITNPGNVQQTGGTSTTSVTITNYALTTGLAQAWTNSDVVEVSCTPY